MQNLRVAGPSRATAGPGKHSRWPLLGENVRIFRLIMAHADVQYISE